MKKYIQILLCCGLSLWCTALEAQFRINQVKLDEQAGVLEIYLNGLKGGKPFIPQDKDAFIINNDEAVNSLAEILEVEDVANKQKAPLSVLFLLDISGSMNSQEVQRRGEKSKLAYAKEAIYKMLKEQNLPVNATFFAPFDSRVFPKQSLTLDNYEEVVGSIERSEEKSQYNTDLYFALNESIDDLKPRKGSKVIILLTDGRNDVQANPRYQQTDILPLESADILNKVSRLDSSFQIYSIGLGYDADREFLKQLSEATQSLRDGFSFAETPEKIEAAYEAIVSGTNYNFVIRTKPFFQSYAGEIHHLSVELNYLDESYRDEIDYSFGTFAHKIVLPERSLASAQDDNTLLTLLIGLALLLSVLLVFWFGVPAIDKLLFKQRYVKPYREVKTFHRGGEVRKMNPVTLMPFEDDDQVVTRCAEQLMPYDAWVQNGGRCYMCGKSHQACDVQTRNHNFFVQQSGNRALNWLWFGAVGSFIGWGLFALLYSWDPSFYQDFFASLFGGVAANVKTASFIGLGLGFGISLMLAWVEELGQSRKISIGRIALRSVLGALASWLVFFVVGFIYIYTQQVKWLGDLIAWLLFGTALAWGMSIRSSIEQSKALKGGVLAAAVGFLVYSLLIWMVRDMPELGKLLSFMAYGSVLGAMIIAIVSKLEDFELQYVQPSHWSGQKNAISKWLKAGLEIYIGTADVCHVFVKWNDPVVQAKHAKLSLEKERVYLEPLAQTLINGREVTQKTQLKDGDRIKLGFDSRSVFRFSEKHQQPAQSAGPRTSTSTTPSAKIRIVKKVSASERR